MSFCMHSQEVWYLHTLQWRWWHWKLIYIFSCVCYAPLFAFRVQFTRRFQAGQIYTQIDWYWWLAVRPIRLHSIRALWFATFSLRGFVWVSCSISGIYTKRRGKQHIAHGQSQNAFPTTKKWKISSVLRLFILQSYRICEPSQQQKKRFTTHKINKQSNAFRLIDRWFNRNSKQQ